MADINRMALARLRKLYGYEIAISKQKDGTAFASEKEEFEILAMHHFMKSVTESAMEFVDTVGDGAEMLAAIVSILSRHSGELTGVINCNYGKIAEGKVREMAKKSFDVGYSLYSGEKK